MFLIEVLPLARLPRTLPETFTYFSGEPIPRGAIVEITVQRRKVIGIVFSCSSVRDAKQRIRAASFTLKRINRLISSTQIFNSRDWKFFEWMSEFYLAPPSIILRLLIPTAVAKNFRDWEMRADPPNSNREAAPAETRVIIDPKSEAIYPRLIEKVFSRDSQVLIVAPEIIRSKYLFEELQEKFPKISLHHVTSKTSILLLRKLWHRIRKGEPLIIIGTRSALFLPFLRLSLLIIDDDGSPSHKSWDQEPRYHVRDVAKALQELHGATLVLTGGPPSLESYQLVNDHQPGTFLTITPEPSGPLSLFVDMQKEIKEENGFVVISQVVKDKIRAAIQENGRAVCFVNRKGFAPFILCQECGHVFRCSNCSVPLVYHVQESLEERTLLCHHCSAKQKAPDVCLHCGSHKLKPYGIGIERVTSDLVKLFPGTPIIPIQKEESGNSRTITMLATKLRETPSYIAVATEFALLVNLLPPMELAAIISVDTALLIPDFLQNERLFRILASIRRLAKKTFILQSFSREPELLKDLLHGSFQHFAEKELKERRNFNYPPYSELIKLTIRDANRENVIANAKTCFRNLSTIAERLGHDTIEVTRPYPAYVEKKKGFFIFHILIKIKDQTLSRSARLLIKETLPKYVIVDAGPTSLL